MENKKSIHNICMPIPVKVIKLLHSALDCSAYLLYLFLTANEGLRLIYFKIFGETMGPYVPGLPTSAPLSLRGTLHPLKMQTPLYKHCGYFRAEDYLQVQSSDSLAGLWLYVKKILLLASCPGIFNLQNDKKTEKSCCQHGVNRQKSSNLVCSQTPL